MGSHEREALGSGSRASTSTSVVTASGIAAEVARNAPSAISTSMPGPRKRT